VTFSQTGFLLLTFCRKKENTPLLR
jgi:hypothetical protein